MDLDLRPVSPKERLATVLPLFEKLERGRGITLISDSSELDLLASLQQRQPGEFDWFQLETSPGRWLLVLSRRPEGMPRHRQVLEVMEADHRRIHEILDRLGEAAGADDVEAVMEIARYLQSCLERHFRIEEQVLLPVVAERLGSPRGPAAVLRDEHVQINSSVQRILGGGDGMPIVLERCKELASLLTHHSAMEERILYAVTDLLLNEVERDELLHRCQNL